MKQHGMMAAHLYSVQCSLCLIVYVQKNRDNLNKWVLCYRRPDKEYQKGDLSVTCLRRVSACSPQSYMGQCISVISSKGVIIGDMIRDITRNSVSPELSYHSCCTKAVNREGEDCSHRLTR